MPRTTPETAGFSTDRLQRITPWMQGYVERGEVAGMIATIAPRSPIKPAMMSRLAAITPAPRKPMPVMAPAASLAGSRRMKPGSIRPRNS